MDRVSGLLASVMPTDSSTSFQMSMARGCNAIQLRTSRALGHTTI